MYWLSEAGGRRMLPFCLLSPCRKRFCILQGGFRRRACIRISIPRAGGRRWEGRGQGGGRAAGLSALRAAVCRLFLGENMSPRPLLSIPSSPPCCLHGAFTSSAANGWNWAEAASLTASSHHILGWSCPCCLQTGLPDATAPVVPLIWVC